MRATFVGLLAALSAGCTTLSTAPGPAGGKPCTTPWVASGRIGVVNGEERLAGQLRWVHRRETDDLLMTSPLGQGVARLLRDPEGVALEIPGHPVQRAADAETLTRAALGYALPVEGLISWITGRADATRPAVPEYDPAGNLSRLAQDGWTVEYLAHGSDGCPRKLALKRDALAIRLVIDRWEAAE